MFARGASGVLGPTPRGPPRVATLRSRVTARLRPRGALLGLRRRIRTKSQAPAGVSSPRKQAGGVIINTNTPLLQSEGRVRERRARVSCPSALLDRSSCCPPSAAGRKQIRCDLLLRSFN